MTHQDWITAIATAIAAAVGGLAGGVLALVAARWTNQQTEAIAKQERAEQHRLVEEQRRMAVESAAGERELDRAEQRQAIARNAAVVMLERIGDLNRVLPNVHRYRGGTRPPLGGWGTEQQLDTRDAVDTFRRGLRTDLLLIHDREIVSRYRELASLVLGLQADLGSEAVINRAIVDVENYIKYVLISLQAFIEGTDLPAVTGPPILRRNENDGSNWLPQIIPEDWDRI